MHQNDSFNMLGLPTFFAPGRGLPRFHPDSLNRAYEGFSCKGNASRSAPFKGFELGGRTKQKQLPYQRNGRMNQSDAAADWLCKWKAQDRLRYRRLELEGGQGAVFILSQLIGHATDEVLQHPAAVIELPQRLLGAPFGVRLDRLVIGLDQLAG